MDKQIVFVDLDIGISPLLKYTFEQQGMSTFFFQNFDDLSLAISQNLLHGSQIFIFDLLLYFSLEEVPFFRLFPQATFFLSCVISDFQRFNYDLPAEFHGFLFKPFSVSVLLEQLSLA